MNKLKYINDMLEIAKAATDRIKEENKRLRAENERLIAIIGNLTKNRDGIGETKYGEEKP